ncbi:hypothetical protein BGZ70_009115 [Mortierella alpina]|uniref:XPG-I domain-containing protein n=1 Tax=Mortierella alpina TaxID=64518 RepID=A0A9P6M113_MORAP|nr:hypothetical protein BGZ70_009115 [Mortierella alpina]
MGVVGLWPYIRKKGYDPELRQTSSIPSSSASTAIRLDILGTYFAVIQSAYSRHPANIAHAVVERAILTFGNESALILYLDGGPSEEKKATQQAREDRRKTALDLARTKVAELERRVDEHRRTRKQIHITIKTSLRAGFVWSSESKAAFAAYMRGRGWDVRECGTEADVAIAKECGPGDIIVTKDSDFVIYSSITTIWRPVTRYKFLAYDVQAVQVALGLNRVQLTVLGVISKNDYGANIYSLGPATNHSIVKTLKGKDPEKMVEDYLSHSLVRSRNTELKTFQDALRVLVRLDQTPLQSAVDQGGQHLHTATYTATQERYARVCRKIEENRKQRPREQKSGETSERPRNLEGATKSYNKYRTVVGPPGDKSEDSLPPRPRYAAKTRRRRIVWPAPERMKRYKWKPHKPGPEPATNQNSEHLKARRKRRKKTMKAPTSIRDMTKMQLVKAIDREHPLVALTVGTVEANAMRASGNDTAVGEEVVRTLQEVARIVGECKTQVQLLIGRFIQATTKQGRPLTQEERDILDAICPPLTNASEEEEDEDEDGDSDQDQVRFLSMLLRHVYSRDRLAGTKLGKLAGGLVRRCPLPEATLAKTYPGMAMFDSTGRQLATEIKGHFKRGCQDIIEKLEVKVKKGLLAQDALEINHNESTIMNFVRLNALLDNPRKVVPVSTAVPSFVSFSERELLPLLWKSEIIRAKLLDMAGRPDMNRVFMEWWLSEQEPGRLTSELLTTVGRGRLGRGKSEINPTGYQRSTVVWSFEQVRVHLESLRREGFDATNYSEKGYVLRGGISTDGFRLHLLAHKLKELQGVRFRRITIPSRLTSTLGGTTDYLTEVRNVLKSPADVASLWQCDPSKIKIVGIDLGQACVFGASALPPACDPEQPGQHVFKGKAPATVTIPPAAPATPTVALASSAALLTATPIAMAVDLTSAAPVASTTIAATPATTAYRCAASDLAELAPAMANTSGSTNSAVFHNMSVKAKAVYQPVLKFRRWANDSKNAEVEGGESIGSIESNIPSMSGKDADFDELTTYLTKHHIQLHEFYGRRYQKHLWDSRRAKETEYAAAAEQLLQMVGGTIGEKRRSDNYVLFGIGLGQFSSTSGLTSLHGTFGTYLVKLLRRSGRGISNR